MIEIAQKTFTSELVLETSLSPVASKLGKHKSTMILYAFGKENPDYYFIEWDIPSLNEVENIGIWCEDGTKNITDYDGVFQLSNEALELLRDNGFNTENVE